MLKITEQIFEQIKKAQNIGIISSNESGDNISSSIALFLFLQKLNKKTDIIIKDFSKPKKLSFLNNFDKIRNDLNGMNEFIISLNLNQTKIDKVKYRLEDDKLDFIVTPKDGKFTPEDVICKNKKPNYDLIIMLGCSDLESLGKIYEENTNHFYNTTIINIDNNPANENFGQINLIDLNTTSVSEILFNMLSDRHKNLIDEDIATCILTGMIIRTKSFKTNNVTPQALNTASELMTLGADRINIVNKLYRNRNIEVLNIWGKVLTNLSNSLNNKLVWSKLKQSDIANTKTNQNDLIDVIDELIVSIPQAKMIILFTEINNNKTLATLYSPKTIDCLEIAKEFNPTGNKKLANIYINEQLNNAEQKIINSITEKMNSLEL